MKPLKSGGACVVIAALVAIMAAAPAQSNPRPSTAAPTGSAAFALSASQSLDLVTRAEVAAVARLGIPLQRAQEAIAVQSAVEREDLINELSDALGNAFGGAWYVPAAAQLDVGVTSEAAARVAEATAVRAGLGLSVTEIPVRSSEAELDETQKGLNRSLAGLFAREAVASWSSVEDNAVYVELGPEVSDGERAAVEGDVSDSPVKVVVTKASGPRFESVPQACVPFVKEKAYCDPTIVAGTTFINEAKKPECTVGPAVVPPKGVTETYVLTAGHCVSKAAEAWSSANKAGEVKEVGKVAAYMNPAKKENADVAAVKVENAFWKKAGEIPVVPAIALWEAGKETVPFNVTGQVAPAVKAMTCFSGQMSGSPKCGMVKMTKYTSTSGVEELVEVEGVKTIGGDSGGPWYSDKKLVQGIHWGERGETGNPLYEPLEWVLKRLKEVPKLELELLISANEKRM